MCQTIRSFPNISAVFVGGDMAGTVASHLVSTCHEIMLPLPQTNNYRPNGARPIPTWRVECKDGGPRPGPGLSVAIGSLRGVVN